MKTTRSWSTAIGVVIAAVAVAVAGAGDASATEDEFIYDLNNSGIVGPRNLLLELGGLDCGATAGEAVTAINSKSQLGVDRSQFVYDSAVNYLC